jgi:hypothetical protein
MVLLALVLAVGLVPGSLATCHGVFCTSEIPSDCEAPAVCATLYFYDAAGVEVTRLQGTGDYRSEAGLDRHAIKGVASVQQVAFIERHLILCSNGPFL